MNGKIKIPLDHRTYELRAIQLNPQLYRLSIDQLNLKGVDKNISSIYLDIHGDKNELLDVLKSIAQNFQEAATAPAPAKNWFGFNRESASVAFMKWLTQFEQNSWGRTKKNLVKKLIFEKSYNWAIEGQQAALMVDPTNIVDHGVLNVKLKTKDSDLAALRVKLKSLEDTTVVYEILKKVATYSKKDLVEALSMKKIYKTKNSFAEIEFGDQVEPRFTVFNRKPTQCAEHFNKLGSTPD